MPEEVDEGMVRSASQLLKDANDLALFKGMKAFVAGAAGGTGKKIVEQVRFFTALELSIKVEQ
jgi:hypothetical protein